MRIVAELADGKPAVFVLGNHEHWHGELQRGRDVARRAAEQYGVVLLDDDEAELKAVSGDRSVRFVGGTLWADGQLGGQDAHPGQPTGEQVRAAHGVWRHFITFGDEAALHARTRGVLEAAIARPEIGQWLVVVTHHAPHLLCLPEAHRTEWVASDAASDRQRPGGAVGAWPRPRQCRLAPSRRHADRLQPGRARVYQPGVPRRLGVTV